MLPTLIVTFVLIGLLVLCCLYLIIKEINTTKRINNLADFVHGDAFSDRFHHVVANYFLDENNVKYLTDPISPLIEEMVAKYVSNQYKYIHKPQQDTKNTKAKTVNTVASTVESTVASTVENENETETEIKTIGSSGIYLFL
jgi:hypothetical protein